MHHAGLCKNPLQTQICCVACAGVSAGARVDEGCLATLLALLPAPASNFKLPPPAGLEAVQYIAVLQCLQRLAACIANATVIAAAQGEIRRLP